jgi:hypothetical protein
MSRKFNEFRPESQYADGFKQIQKTVEPKVMPKPGPERELVKEYELFTNYNPSEDLERVRQVLDLSFHVKGPDTFFSTSKDEARVRRWYDSRLVEILAAEVQYRERLDFARKSGEIDEGDYIKAIMKLSSPTSPFQRAREEARDVLSRDKIF